MSKHNNEGPPPSALTSTLSTLQTGESVIRPMVYTAKEVEPLLRLSKNTVNALLNSGQLRAVRCGRKWLIPHEAVMEFLQNRRLT